MAESEGPFWETKRLEQMEPHEWEALCDGCGQCCLHKLEDEDTGEIFYTKVACKLLDCHSCRCTNYAKRKRLVPDCVQLDVKGARRFNWLPETCAYRLLAHGQPLPSWHPLISGDPESVHRAGISVRGRAVSERDIDPEALEDYIYGGD